MNCRAHTDFSYTCRNAAQTSEFAERVPDEFEWEMLSAVSADATPH